MILVFISHTYIRFGTLNQANRCQQLMPTWNRQLTSQTLSFFTYGWSSLDVNCWHDFDVKSIFVAHWDGMVMRSSDIWMLPLTITGSEQNFNDTTLWHTSAFFINNSWRWSINLVTQWLWEIRFVWHRIISIITVHHCIAYDQNEHWLF